MPQRAFVTGASGFIGRALADRLRAAGAEVRGMDLAADPARGVVAGDVAAPGAWQRHAAGCDLFVHTAALVSLGGGAEAFWRVNVAGTRNALDAARDGGAARFVHLSSVLAFSPRFPDGVDESHPVRPNGTPYVDTKVASEQVVLQAHARGEVECSIVRPGDVYGPRSRPWTVLPVELIRARLMTALPRGVFSPVFVDDLVDGILLAAAGPAGGVHVLTGGRGVPNEEFFGHYFRMLGRRGPLIAPRRPLRAAAAVAARVAAARGRDSELNPASIDYLARTGTYSIARARRELGYDPKVDLPEGMRRTEDWLRETGMLA